MKKLISIIFCFALLFSANGAVFAQSSNDLTSSEALKLAKSARIHFWNVMNGHKLLETKLNCPMTTFNYNGTEYRYFCSEFNTKNKLQKYMREVFTLNASEKGFKKYKFIEYKGKLAQPNADSGSLLEWDKSKVKLIYQRKNICLFEYTVPYGEPKMYEKRNITFVKVNNQWKINSFDAVH